MKIDLICDHKVTLPSPRLLSTAAVLNSFPSSPRHIFDPSSPRQLELPFNPDTDPIPLCRTRARICSAIVQQCSALTMGSQWQLSDHRKDSSQPSQPQLLQARVPQAMRRLSAAASLISSKPPHCLVHPLYRSQLRPVTCGYSFLRNNTRL